MNKISRHLHADWPSNMSYDKSDSSVDKFYSSVNGVLSEQTSIFYNKRQIDIFLLAMAIGKELNTRIPIKHPSQSIRRDALNEDEVWMMCCVALSEEKGDLEILADPTKLIKICEEYSNGGIRSLIQLENQTDLNNSQYEELLEKAIQKL